MARVDNVNILGSEYHGQILDATTVAFRGFRMEWAKVLETDEEVLIPQ